MLLRPFAKKIKKLRKSAMMTKKLRNLQFLCVIMIAGILTGGDYMKKIVSTLLIISMLASFSLAISAETEKELDILKPDFKNNIMVYEDCIRYNTKDSYFGFKAVDLTGIKSIGIRVLNTFIRGAGENGDTLVVKADDPLKGDVLGYIVMAEAGEHIFKTSIFETEGVHDLYFVSLYGENRGNSNIYEINLYKDEYVQDKSACVPDSYIKDLYSDTWAATDSYGRKVADYCETGAVKTDGREVGIMYWNWFVADTAKNRGRVISDVLKEHPEARDDYYHEAWGKNNKYFWTEPVLGFYDSYDYWVYRKHAEMLAVAGVDVIFTDCTNAGYTFTEPLTILAKAFRDAKRTGIDVPKISVIGSLGRSKYAFTQPMAIYMNFFVGNDYSDIWYYRDGKPMIFSTVYKADTKKYANEKDTAQMDLAEEIHDFFTFRYAGAYRNSKVAPNEWFWLEEFPQQLRNPDETGRPEMVAVGCSINTTVNAAMGVATAASNPYAKGRSFSEVFNRDYSADSARKAYFFREQAALALAADPEFVFIDGWNELSAERKSEWYGQTNTFVDTFDDENSRDFEPSRGTLKDDYYMLLCDFVRKFKGVRPAPVASGMKAIDINGELSQWSEVGPDFLNANQDYERDSVGYAKAGTDFEPNIYKTTVNNAVKSAKVSFDNENFYFLVSCEKDIKEHDKSFLNLYINTDRMYNTGWEGYDYAFNVSGKGVISKNAGNVWCWESIGNAEYRITGNSMMVSFPRSFIGETEKVDFEFKWTDSVSAEDDFMNFYSDGSVAPYGRFNYLYTEKEQTALTDYERMMLSDTAIIKAGAENMIVAGGKMPVYEKNRNVRAFSQNGTLYIPEDALCEVLGYGRTKTDYNSFYNVSRTYHYEMNDELTEVINYKWTYTTLGTNVARVDGKLTGLSNPVISRDGIVFIPLSFIEECYGYEVKAIGEDVYTVCTRGTAPIDTVMSVLHHFD